MGGSEMMNHVSIAILWQPTDKYVSTISIYTTTSPISRIILLRVAAQAP
jgi:hypothetical protein